METPNVLLQDANGNPIQTIFVDTNTYQLLDGSSSAATSTVIDATYDRIVRVLSMDDVAWCSIGANPTAQTNTGMPLAADIPEYFSIPKGNKISVYGAIVSVVKSKYPR